MSAIISRLLGTLGFNQPKPSIQHKIDAAIIRLEMIEDKVAEIRYRFEKRSRELFEKVVTLLRTGEKSRAAIYAGEVSQIRNILKMIVTTEHLIVMAKERLKTVKDVRDLGMTLMVFGAALEEVKDKVTAIYPNLNLTFEELTKSVRSLIVETSVEAIGQLDPVTISNNALEVLYEASKKAEERIKSSFPEPPVEPLIRVKPRREPVALAVPGAPGVAYQTGHGIHRPTRSIEEIEQLVLNYIKTHNGYLDLRDFTTRYGIPKNQVLQALHRLAERGLIRVA